jgi:alkylation response protein AidB-like acyl-CoA dehydrogenase
MVPLRVEQIIDFAKTLQLDGKPAIDEPLVRDTLVRFLIEERGLELSQRRARIPSLVQPRPYAIAMMSKLVVTELRRRLCAYAVSLQGANANLYVGDPNAHSDGDYQRGYMNAFSATIGGGTSQIQANIIGERVLGLGKG